MSRQIYVNLPVKQLERSRAFFAALGFEFNPLFSDETAICMVVSETIYVMLLTEDKFRMFTPRPLCDAHAATEVLVCLSSESREAIDAMVGKAVAAGGRVVRPAEDHGFMYSQAFADPDGHIWELVWMDLAAFEKMRAG